MTVEKNDGREKLRKRKMMTYKITYKKVHDK